MDRLSSAIEEDRKQRLDPFLIVGSIGTTSGGLVEPLDEMTKIARHHNLWLHIDAAWGGAAVLLPEFESTFQYCQHADSLTLDAHKWLSVPMTASLLITKHPGLLRQTFSTDRSHYMPHDSKSTELHHPYQESIQWSRRWLGLKLFLAQATLGIDGYRSILRHQIEMGDVLKTLLEANDWEVLNRTPLPVACFIDRTGKIAPDQLEEFASAVAASGKAWVTTTEIPPKRPVLRAGIANHRTQTQHLEILVETLNATRERFSQ
jgi:glutamate/tyrosine decarboxylase-like PLP-dependent enzyme